MSEPTEEMSKTAALLESLNGGETMRDAAADLAELIAAVEETGGKGSLTITLKLERKQNRRVIIRAAVKPSIPREEPNPELRYVTREGELSANDPDQSEFEFQNVTPMQSAAGEA